MSINVFCYIYILFIISMMTEWCGKILCAVVFFIRDLIFLRVVDGGVLFGWLLLRSKMSLDVTNICF